MAIQLVTEKVRGGIDETNFAEYMQALDDMLEPGMPVMIQEYSRNYLGKGAGRYSKRILFFSGGNLSEDGVFNLQEGERNFSYVLLSEKDSASYQIVRYHKEELDNYRLTVPESWIREHHNEGTFSPAGSREWNSSHSAGTEEIIFWDILAEQFPDALYALKFANDAVYFSLHPFYSMQSHLVTEMGDDGIRGEQEIQRERQTHRIACLRAAMNLLKEAEIEIDGYNGALKANQAGWFSDGTQTFRDQGFPVGSEDYLIQQASYPSKIVAFVKAGEGIGYGETYILPASGRMDKIVDLAFSKDTIKMHYPHGFKE